jgi:hypothetical protein
MAYMSNEHEMYVYICDLRLFAALMTAFKDQATVVDIAQSEVWYTFMWFMCVVCVFMCVK